MPRASSRSAGNRRFGSCSAPLAPVVFCLLGVLGQPGVASAKSHLWRFTEVFSNADGSIQFIEMFVFDSAGTAEIQFGGRPLTSSNNTFIFPNNLPNENTYNRAVLIATQSFADLPGAPVPDYILPEHFFDPAGDEIRYRSFVDVIEIAPGALPIDGVGSLQKDEVGNLSTGTNSPMNFAGETGSVSLGGQTNPGSVAFQQAELTVVENETPASISVLRQGGTDGAISVEVAVTGGSAVEEVDFDLDPTILSWTEGDATPKAVDLLALPDGVDEGAETVQLGLRNTSGGVTLGTPSDLMVTIVDPDAQEGEPEVCQPQSERLCLNEGRFAVDIDWRDFDGNTGKGQAVPLTADSGYFWFFSDANVEVVVKVLDACSFADRFWVFAAGLTNVEVTLRVHDTASDEVRIYTSELEEAFEPILDVNAFATCP